MLFASLDEPFDTQDKNDVSSIRSSEPINEIAPPPQPWEVQPTNVQKEISQLNFSM
jgi:hypothetical protein